MGSEGKLRVAEESEDKKTRADRFALKHGEALVEHMSKGYSFRSFAAISDIPLTTLLRWADKNKNFQKYKELAEAKSLLYWETIGIASAQGQLRRVKSETVKQTTFYDADGKPEKDDKGNTVVKEEVVHREHEPVSLSQTMWIFVMRSRFGWLPEGPDLMDPENNPGNKLKKFQLAYSTKDQPYVITEKPKPETTKEEKPDGPSSDAK